MHYVSVGLAALAAVYVSAMTHDGFIAIVGVVVGGAIAMLAPIPQRKARR